MCLCVLRWRGSTLSFHLLLESVRHVCCSKIWHPHTRRSTTLKSAHEQPSHANEIVSQKFKGISVITVIIFKWDYTQDDGQHHLWKCVLNRVLSGRFFLAGNYLNRFIFEFWTVHKIQSANANLVQKNGTGMFTCGKEREDILSHKNCRFIFFYKPFSKTSVLDSKRLKSKLIM